MIHEDWGRWLARRDRKEQFKAHAHGRREKTAQCDVDPSACHVTKQTSQPEINS